MEGYGANLKNMKFDEVRMNLKECDYYFDTKQSTWHMTVQMDAEFNEGKGVNINYKKILKQLHKQNRRISSKVNEMQKRIDDMEKRCRNAEFENEKLMDQYASEYIEAEKIEAARKKLDALNSELFGTIKQGN